MDLLLTNPMLIWIPLSRFGLLVLVFIVQLIGLFHEMFLKFTSFGVFHEHVTNLVETNIISTISQF